MRQEPMMSVAGIRATLGGSLYPDDFFRYVQAYATLVKGGRVVVGGDTRPSREVLRRIVLGALTSAGCDVADLGVVPTPTVGLMVRRLKAAGGIVISASHNPVEWSALKFIAADGTFMTAAMNRLLLKIWAGGEFRRAQVDALGVVQENEQAPELHIQQIMKHVNVQNIRARKLKVVVDLCNGAGAVVVPQLLERLGVEAGFIFADPAKAFEREAEPLPANLGRLCRAVKRAGADLGCALDPDADRLALVDETGRAIGEERTLTLVANHYLRRKKSPLVANLSTTRALEDVARAHGVKCFRTAIGEAHVVSKMLACGSALGGEGNGGVICPAIHPGRDAQTGIALICEALAVKKCALSELNAAVPDYVLIKDKISVEGKNVGQILARIEGYYKGRGRANQRDGLRIDFADRWLHVRPSGTEPIIRAFVEAPTPESAAELLAEAKALL